jgi:hypothetical protein
MNAHNARSSRPSAIVHALTCVAVLAYPTLSHAEGDADAAETALARTLAVEGVKLAQADRCSEAVDKLERSQKLKHSPIVLSHLGECQVKVGRWVEGSESLRKLLREALPENATPALAAAYESAAATLRDLKPRIPSLKITLDLPPNTDFTVKVDGKEVADSVVGVALPTDPGEHTIEATAPGFLKASSTMKVQPGSAATVALELEKDPAANAQALASAAPPATAPAEVTALQPEQAPPAPATHSSNTGRVLGWVSYAVGAVGLGAGIAFGQSAISDEKSLRSDCPNRVCGPAQQDALDFAKTKGTIATVGFAVAGGGAVLGTVLLLTSSSSSSGNARAAKPRIAGISRPRALLGPGGVALAGDF